MCFIQDNDEDDAHELHIQNDYLEQPKDYELDLSEYT